MIDALPEVIYMKVDRLTDHVENPLVLKNERGFSHAGNAEVWY
jgi:hypothetical protein